MDLLALSLFLIIVVCVLSVRLYCQSNRIDDLKMNLWKERSLNQSLIMQMNVLRARVEK